MPAPAAQPRSPARPGSTLSRQDLLGLGRAGRPREFLPIAARAVRQIPDDLDLRFLMAAACAQLGLRTLAAETLAALPEPARADANVKALTTAVDGLPDDRVPADSRRAIAEGNLGVLRDRGLASAAVLDAAWPGWLDRLELHDCFRSTDGNLIRRGPGDDLPHWTAFLTDGRSIAAQFCEQRLGGTDMFTPPLAIEGIDPPWLAEGAWRRLAPNRVGYAAPITLVQADPLEFLDGLSAMDLRDVLADERVRVFVGPDASSRWLEDAVGRLDEVAMGMAIATPGVRTRIEPDAQTVTNRWGAAQAEALRETQTRVASAYGPRDRAWWADRYAEAASGGEPLRVLIPTSRYSTFIRHASEDLAEAFCGLGCEARVVMEPANGRPTSVGQLRWADPFEPDLIVLANYFRRDAGLPFPEQVPWVCWIQDAMAHQFQEREFTELDFVAGHLHKELRAQDGFPHDRALPFPLIASERKFHPGPVDAERHERFACEVAYVSHQSETPAAFHARCVAEEPKPEVCRVLEHLRPLVEAEAADPLGESLYNRLGALTGAAAERLANGTDALAQYLFRHYALPLADRVVRHQTLGWAASICGRHGWRLRLHGRGWDSHPELAEYARGEISHGDDLRACYQSAAVHLHASVNTLVHQRVMECAMSGGLPVGRLTADAVDESVGFAEREAVLHGTPCGADVATGAKLYRLADHAALAAVRPLREWLGLETPDEYSIAARKIESFRKPGHPLTGGMHAAWLFGDLRELTVRSEDDLERIIERAVRDDAWRSAQSAAIARRARERCSTTAFAERVLGLVRRSLADGTETP
ncbi:MAG: hypothetical protein ACF8LK_07345 [Phycisphaerales bacterium JB041]